MPHLLIVSSRYYADIASALEKSAVTALNAAHATHELVVVPGALEIPTAIRFALETKRFDGYVALGCVIRGETTHYDTVCDESARGLSWLAMDQQAAIGNGILTVENEAQARARLDKGADAAQAALALITVRNHFQGARI